jgi:hypothetical protein
LMRLSDLKRMHYFLLLSIICKFILSHRYWVILAYPSAISRLVD